MEYRVRSGGYDVDPLIHTVTRGFPPVKPAPAGCLLVPPLEADTMIIRKLFFKNSQEVSFIPNEQVVQTLVP